MSSTEKHAAIRRSVELNEREDPALDDMVPLTRLISAFTLPARASQMNRWRNDGYDHFLHASPIKPVKW